MTQPPPIIDSAKLLEYAKNDAGVEFTGKLSLYVAGLNKELQPIGEMPNLAIFDPYNQLDEYFLFFCDEDWEPKGIIGFCSCGGSEGASRTSL